MCFTKLVATLLSMKAVVKLLGEMKMLLAAQCKVVSKILQLHILLATRALTPQSHYQLYHYSVHCQCCVYGNYYSQCTHHYHPRFMCTTKQSMQIIFSYKVSWSGWFRMFIQLEHWKSAREMLDVAVWNHDGYSGCTTWKLMVQWYRGASRLLCAVVP